MEVSMSGCGVIIVDLKSTSNACFVYNSPSLERDPVDQSLEQVMMQHRLHHRWHGHTPVRYKDIIYVRNDHRRNIKMSTANFKTIHHGGPSTYLND
jgi:hypothetical protein